MNLPPDDHKDSKDRDLSGVSAKRIMESVKWFIIAEELIPKGSLVLAAVSGGHDSMAMLSILHHLSKELDFGLAVAHFDHGLRPSSKQYVEVVEQFAKKHSLAFSAGCEDVRELAAASGDTIEEAARKARYQFLFRSAEACGASRIATGHTKDDQIETIVMRLLRGCGIRGLAGIPIQRGKLIRPLLATSRNETHAYCEAHSISTAVDPSNQDPQFFRNRIRLEVLPLLRGVQSSVDENILRLSDNARRLIHAMREKTQPLLKRHSRKLSDNEWKLNVTRLSSIDDTSLVVLFGDLFTEKMGLDMDFTQPHFDQLIHLARSASASGKMVSLPSLQVKREFENLIFTIEPAKSPRPAPTAVQITLTVPGRTPAGEMTLITEILERGGHAEGSFKAGKDEAYFAMERIKLPLVLRSPKPGDRMQPFGMRGYKKLSDIFIDKKIPGRERSKTMVLSDSEGILWLVGITTSERGRIALKTEKILKITIEQE